MSHNLCKDIEKMLQENNMQYDAQVVHNLKCVAENLTIKILKDASYYKPIERMLNKEDILFAIAMDNENEKMVKPLDSENIAEIANEVNTKSIALKEVLGLRIPKESLGNCNYQLENPKKRMKMEAANKFENYGSKQFGNCFTFLMPQKHYKQTPNMGGFMIKNNQNMRDGPMKITIRPKFNVQPNMSMLKKNYN